LHPDQIPFADGTPEYYRYVAEWRAKALGLSYDPPRGLGDDEGYDKDAYEEGLKAWRQQQYEQTKSWDRTGQDAIGYGWGVRRDQQAASPGTQFFYDLNGNGFQDGVEVAGKYQNPALPYDNRWSDLDGVDPRTDEQRFYNRDLSDFEQVADENGTYSTYANWEYRDGAGSTQKKRLNLTYLGDRDGRDDAGNDIVGSGLDYARDKETAAFSGHDYYKYNDAPEKAYFDEMTRKRENLSRYARTA
jgi:hypothetical protein